MAPGVLIILFRIGRNHRRFDVPKDSLDLEEWKLQSGDLSLPCPTQLELDIHFPSRDQRAPTATLSAATQSHSEAMPRIGSSKLRYFLKVKYEKRRVQTL